MLKIFGAVLIVAGCVAMGLRYTLLHKKEAAALKQLIAAIEYMECELQYRLTSLPQLCRQVGKNSDCVVAEVFSKLADELENQVSPDVRLCMESAIAKMNEIPTSVRCGFELLGATLGRFDIEGQLRDLNSVRSECLQQLKRCTYNEDTRLRSYRTMAVCAGIAAVILLF